ncbi:Flp family type IVb pilin [Clostridiales bacterium F-3ap]|uniref:Flp family type IVb pilin n=2 Tax=Anaerotalea alkaliphila TaxID=2662126 RepID=A0A7X5KP10_9FIRM|nr:Flp family type IVb pilin [Anaerotalea alkaliphila]
MLALMKASLQNEEGQGMVEYALIIGLISVVVVAILVLFGEPLQAIFNSVLGALNTAQSS